MDFASVKINKEVNFELRHLPSHITSKERIQPIHFSRNLEVSLVIEKAKAKDSKKIPNRSTTTTILYDEFSCIRIVFGFLPFPIGGGIWGESAPPTKPTTVIDDIASLASRRDNTRGHFKHGAQYVVGNH